MTDYITTIGLEVHVQQEDDAAYGGRHVGRARFDQGRQHGGEMSRQPLDAVILRLRAMLHTAVSAAAAASRSSR